jgi:hypothetical protein
MAAVVVQQVHNQRQCISRIENQLQSESKQLLQARIKREAAAAEVTKGTAEGSCVWLNGQAWYSQQAFRALNQALGRCIRHRHDYGTLLLIDTRFTEDDKLERLPQWLRGKVSVGLGMHRNSFREVEERLARFFERAPTAVAARVRRDEETWQETAQVRAKQEALSQTKIEANMSPKQEPKKGAQKEKRGEEEEEEEGEDVKMAETNAADVTPGLSQEGNLGSDGSFGSSKRKRVDRSTWSKEV